MRYRCLMLTLAWLCTNGFAPAQEWTRFRGPNGSGQSDLTTIPASWKSDDVLWRVALPGAGNGSPVLWGEKIFLLSAEPRDGTRYILCLAADDGRLLWKRQYAAATHAVHRQNSLASSTPAVDAEHVYCAWATPEEFTLVALDHEGNEAWRAQLGPFISQHGYGGSPIVYEDLVIVTDDQDGDSYLVAVDRRSGLTRWKVPRKVNPDQNASYATPCVFRPKGGPDELIVCGWAHGITSVEPQTGKTNWEAAVLERRPVGSPIVVDDLILANCGDGGGNNSVVAIRPGNSRGGEAELVYKIGKGSAPYVPSLVARGNLVFLWGDRGIVTCIDAASGKTHWRQRVGGDFFGSPVRVADCVYCISVEGEVVALSASHDYRLLGRSPLGEASHSTPAVALGRMFLRSESHLTAVGRK